MICTFLESGFAYNKRNCKSEINNVCMIIPCENSQAVSKSSPHHLVVSVGSRGVPIIVRVIFCRVSRLLRREMWCKDMANVTADILLSPLTAIMSPRRNNLEHFIRDTRSPPVGPEHVMRGRDAIYSQGWCRRLLDKKHATHDWCSLAEYLEMNNDQPVSNYYFLFLFSVLKNITQQMQILHILNRYKLSTWFNWFYVLYFICFQVNI